MADTIDKLKEAMQDEYFILEDRLNTGIVLFGKQRIGSHITEEGKETEDYQYCIAQTWKNQEAKERNKDFSIHYIHSYQSLIDWLDKNIEGGYKYFQDLYEKQIIERERQNEWRDKIKQN